MKQLENEYAIDKLVKEMHGHIHDYLQEERHCLELDEDEGIWIWLTALIFIVIICSGIYQICSWIGMVFI